MKTEADGGNPGRDREQTESFPSEVDARGKTVPIARRAGGPANVERRERYRLLNILAHGGLGTVWVARDDDLNRDIALKELQADPSSRPEFLERFLREAQITGQLEHPNIVPVYELGRRKEDGQPFYTMRLVRGQTLWDAIVGYHRRRREQAADPLELPRLLNNFIDVCQALAYAHNRGVIHRDLKPENILLGEFGEVVVLDWGLAKLKDQEEVGATLTLTDSGNPNVTMAGHVLGTPAYMAPEQAQGRLDDLDARTDIYGLGAILFDILTGEPPHPGDDVREVVSKVAYSATPRVRSVDPAVPGPLEAICARAMAFERSDRYQTARELADDVERWLAGEPVSVYPEPLTQQLARWGRKHRTFVASTAALTLTAVVALTIGVVLLTREKDRTASAQARAETNFQKARQAVDKMLRQLAQDQLNDIPHMEQVRRGLLQEALLFYQDFLTQKGNDPELRLELARAQHQLAEIHRLLNEHVASRAAYDEAIEQFTRLSEEFPDKPVYRQGLAAAHNKLGELQRVTGHAEEAEAAYRRALEIQQKLIDEEPAVASHRQEMAQLQYNIGLALFALGRLEESQQAHEQAIALLAPLVEAHPHTPLYQQELARAHLNRGAVQRSRKMSAAAEKSARTAIALLEGLVKHAPFSREYQHELGVVFLNLGNSLSADKERQDEAEKAYQRALEQFSGLVDNFPFIPLYRGELAKCLNSIGGFHLRYQQLAEAEKYYLAAVKLYQGLIEQYPKVPDYQALLGGTLGNLGNVQLKLGDLEQAHQLLDSGLFHGRRALDINASNPTFLQFQRNNLALLTSVCLQQKKYELALKHAERIVPLSGNQAAQLARAAGLAARCLTAVDQDAGLAATERKELSRQCGDKAVEFYRRAFAKGYDDVKALEQSPAFALLSQRADFQQLLQDMRGKALNPPK
ncbi:MAG: protein kinase [Gemmataceae bacterium]